MQIFSKIQSLPTQKVHTNYILLTQELLFFTKEKKYLSFNRRPLGMRCLPKSSDFDNLKNKK